MFIPVNPRQLAAAAILSGWGLGVALFAQREARRTPVDRLTEIALRVAPATRYYAVERNGRQIGFGSSSIDTLARTLQLTEYRVTEEALPGAPRRVTTQSAIRLSRGLALREFSMSQSGGVSPWRVLGWRANDSTLAYVMTQAGVPADTHVVTAAGDVVLPSMAPLLVALGGGLEVGASHRLALFDPRIGVLRTAAVRVTAESLFVVPDSAVYDAPRSRWTIARTDTVRGWRLTIDGGSEAWIDERGQAVTQRTLDSLTMWQTAYELAFENWRAGRPGVGPIPPGARGNVDVALADRLVRPVTGASLAVRLSGIPLAMFDLTGARQILATDTLRVRRVPASAMVPSFVLPPGEQVRLRFSSSLGSAPMIETGHPAIARLSARLAAGEPDAARVAERILSWMRDSLADGPTDGLRGAARTLRDRRGDAQAQALLFVALARAAGVPARAVLGLLATSEHARPHAWAEIFLQGWIPVDPLRGEFPASPAHMRFLVDGVGALDDFIRAIAPLRVDLLPSPQVPEAHD